MDLAELTEKASAALGASDAFSKSVKFDFGDAGKLLIDGVSRTVSNEDGEAEATVKLSWDNFIALTEGKLDPTLAFMQGKLKVLGDMSVAMELTELVKAFK